MLKMLLDDFHLDPNSRDHKGRTTLFSAAAATESKAVKLLIHEYHVDPSARDNLGGTPLSYAVANKLQNDIGLDNILNTVRIILDRNEVDPDSEDAKGRTPLGWAVHAGSKPVVRLLLDTGRIDLSRCFDGHPLVAWAFEYRHLSIAKLLIERGVPDCNIKSLEDWLNYEASGRAGRFDHGFWSDVSGEKGEERVRD
jgi:ankyrin repeat protein